MAMKSEKKGYNSACIIDISKFLASQQGMGYASHLYRVRMFEIEDVAGIPEKIMREE